MRIRPSLLAVAATLSITTPFASADHTLVAENGTPGDRFGWSVAAENGLAVVGALHANRNGLDRTGTAYIFDIATGTQLFELTSDDLTTNGNFGTSVAIDGPTVLIANPGAGALEGQNSGPGTVTVFELATADLNFDGLIGASDLATLLASWGAAGATDLDANGFTDAGDLAILFATWNE